VATVAAVAMLIAVLVEPAQLLRLAAEAQVKRAFSPERAVRSAAKEEPERRQPRAMAADLPHTAVARGFDFEGVGRLVLVWACAWGDFGRRHRVNNNDEMLVMQAVSTTTTRCL
jgi:hypothetical protein